MPKKKFTEQANANLTKVLKAYKTLEPELKRVKKDIKHMMEHRHNAPPGPNRPPRREF